LNAESKLGVVCKYFGASGRKKRQCFTWNTAFLFCCRL